MAGRWRHRVAVASVLLALAVVGTTLTGLWRFATQDRPDVVDQPTVVRTANAACLIMRKAVHRLSAVPEAGIAHRAAAIRAQNDEVLLMVDRIRALGYDLVSGDLPLQTWLNDWERLVGARESYAASLLAGRPRQLTLPEDGGGEPVTTRMNSVGLDCTVPLELTGGG
ncbi:MAG TPA: hypothetical protein VH915_06865 [Pedococcus sp.]|jgi:hypothetical protein